MASLDLDLEGVAMTRSRRRTTKRPPIAIPQPDLAAPPGGAGESSTAAAIRWNVIAFSPERVEELVVESVAELERLRAVADVLWINIEGGEDAASLERIGQSFGLHTLALEDAVHVHQRPKAEDYGDHVYVVLQMPRGTETQSFEQFSIFFGKNFVITVQEGLPGDCLEPLRRRIRGARGRVRERGADYLAYSIMDALVDSVFPVVEALNDRLERLEDQVLNQHGDELASEIHAVRHELHVLRRVVASSREAIGSLLRGEAGTVSDPTLPFLRDCHDHTAQLLDAVEALRELVAGLMDLHHAAASRRMNEVMKLLTIIATIFIPLSFIAGVYGMNFDRAASPWNMPELEWQFGYPFALSLMAGTAAGFLIYFRLRGWLGRARESGLR